MKKLMSFSLAFIAGPLCLTLLLSPLQNADARQTAAPGSAETRTSARKASIVFVASARYARPLYLRTWHDWLDSGYEIDIRSVSSIETVEDLRPYNAVVINFLPQVDSRQNVIPEQIPFEKALDDYMKAGGGVVVFCGGGTHGAMKPALCHLLKPYGAYVPEEQIVDDEHIMGHVLEGRLKANFTTQIEKAPMTLGVTKIGYIGEASRADVIKLMMPLVIEHPGKWHVVVRGEKTAYSAGGKRPGFGPEIKETPESYAEYPVMAAWRTVGKGRLFVFPHNVCQTVTSPDVFENFFWDPNDTKRDDRPDNRTFIMQTVAWAAQPSLREGNFGGFVTDRSIRPEAGAILKSAEHVPSVPIKWEEVKPVSEIAPKMYSLKGLIGAQSTFSGGEYTVAQLCAAARKAGLDFLAFTEKLEEMNADKWQRLQDACDQASDKSFLAFPGLWALDKVGNRLFGFGKARFPRPTSVTPDGKRIDNLAQFWINTYDRRMTGFADVNKNPNPWFEMRQTSGFAVFTYEGGQLRDEAFRGFCESSYNMENYFPFSVSVVTSPEDIASAAANMVNVFTGRTLKELDDYVHGKGEFTRSTFWETPHHWYLSSGPKLEYHGGYNINNLAVDEENENVYRYGFKLSGLRRGDEILLRDGWQVFRKWIASGDTFSLERTWPHDQVRVFVLQVTRNGKTVLIGSPVRHNYGRRFMTCGDRQNSLPFNYQPDKNGDWYATGIPLGCHYKSWEPSTLVYGTVKHYIIGAIGIEANPTIITSWFTSPSIPFDSSRMETYRSLSSVHFHRLSCPGIYIVDDIARRVYPEGGRHGGDQQPPLLTEPLQLFNYTARRYGIYGMIGQLNGQLVESRITALQDVSMKKGQQSVMVSAKHHPPRPNPNLTYWAEKRVDGEVRRYEAGQTPKQVIAEELSRGDYVGCYPQGLAWGGAHYAVAGDLRSRFQIKDNGFSSLISLNVPPRWKKGQNFDYTLFYTTGGSKPTRPESDYQKVTSFLGFDRPFPAIRNLRGGTLLDVPVIATIEAAQDSVVRFNTPLNAEDPIGLTVRITGFNPNWLSVYRLNGSKKWRYMGELDGYFYFNLYTNMQAFDVMAGHPLLADRNDVIIALDDPDGRQSAFEIYNPTDKPLTTTLRANPAFYEKWSTRVQLPPYASKRISLHQ